MKYLLDTNVLSELSKDHVDQSVLTWFESIDQESLMISSITIGEIAYGVEKLPNGARKEQLKQWFENTLVEWFEGRICAIDSEAMLCWAHIKATSRTLPILDSLIAATAVSQGATLVTRNVRDFDGIEALNVVNPF
jgi:predicted nucleic acid-binding protein